MFETIDMTGQDDLFKDLFVLEIANNHWGDLERGLQIIRDHGKIVRKHGVKAAVKFQFRDSESFVHKNFQNTRVDKEDKELTNAPGSNTRYVKKTLSTFLTTEEYRRLIQEVKALGMLSMATPFDEKSVSTCILLDVDIIKIASQDAKSWTLVEKIAEAGKPTIVSNGGTGIGDLDRLVLLFRDKDVPLAINHCASLYPSEDSELELNQVDLLKRRYPNNIIGFSTHEYHDWISSVMITYAKGARTWERHVDIEANGIPVSKYCSLPHQVDEWFESFKKVKEMCGSDDNGQRIIPQREKEYISSVSRGCYARRDLPQGYVVTKEGLDNDFYFAIPAIDGQYTSRDFDRDFVVKGDTLKDKPVMK
jgi:sialic acid synthase SpsE